MFRVFETRVLLEAACNHRSLRARALEIRTSVELHFIKSFFVRAVTPCSRARCDRVHKGTRCRASDNVMQNLPCRQQPTGHRQLLYYMQVPAIERGTLHPAPCTCQTRPHPKLTAVSNETTASRSINRNASLPFVSISVRSAPIRIRAPSAPSSITSAPSSRSIRTSRMPYDASACTTFCVLSDPNNSPRDGAKEPLPPAAPLPCGPAASTPPPLPAAVVAAAAEAAAAAAARAPPDAPPAAAPPAEGAVECALLPTGCSVYW